MAVQELLGSKDYTAAAYKRLLEAVKAKLEELNKASDSGTLKRKSAQSSEPGQEQADSGNGSKPTASAKPAAAEAAAAEKAATVAGQQTVVWTARTLEQAVWSAAHKADRDEVASHGRSAKRAKSK